MKFRQMEFRRMELAHLEAFERVAREGNFTRAARALGLTQPAVSTRLATLEDEVGGALFERKGRQLKLTPLGQQLLPYAERILAVVADSKEAIKRFHSGKTGMVKLAALAPFVMSMLDDPLEQFRHTHPSVDVKIWQRLQADIFDMLYDGTTTLGLLNAPIFDRGIQILAQFQEPVRGVVAMSHPLALLQQTEGHLRMSDLYAHTIFRVTMSPRMTAFIDTVVENARHGSGGAVVSVPMIMVNRLLLQGQGVAFLPESYVAHHIQAQRLTYLDIEDMPRLLIEPILVSLRGRELDEPHREFLAVMIRRWKNMLVSNNIEAK